MATEAVLEKRIRKLKDRLHTARDGGEDAADRSQVRRIRKRLKRNQRKLRTYMARIKKAGELQGKAETQTT